jgi:hypothetical protein
MIQSFDTQERHIQNTTLFFRTPEPPSGGFPSLPGFSPVQPPAIVDLKHPYSSEACPSDAGE